MGKAEIDTSAPFESVREAVDRFGGGSGRWKDHHKGPQTSSDSSQNDQMEDLVALAVEETEQSEKDLMIKERETLEILKELEMTKKLLDGLKVEVQKESSKATVTSEKISDWLRPSPDLILVELKQAKLNLSRTTSDIADLRSSIEMQNIELKREKDSMAKTCERLASNSAQIRCLEKELSQTKLMLQVLEDSGHSNGFGNSPCVSRKFHELRSETEQFKRMTAASSSEVSRIMKEIEQTRAERKTAEVRVHAARKMEMAAKANVATVLAEIESLTDSKSYATVPQDSSGVTLPVAEYNLLVHRAHEAEQLSREKIEAAKAMVTEAHLSKIEVSKKAEEATEEVQNSRKVLEEALDRVEAATKEKLAVEEALRKWRSDHGQKRRSIQSSPRFKNPYYASHVRRDSKPLDMRSECLVSDGSKALLKPTLSVGQILSKKLLGPDEIFVRKEKVDDLDGSPKVSLGQMLSRKHCVTSSESNGGEKIHAPRMSFQAKKKKRFQFAGSIPLMLVNRNGKSRKKRKKKQTCMPSK